MMTKKKISLIIFLSLPFFLLKSQSFSLENKITGKKIFFMNIMHLTMMEQLMSLLKFLREIMISGNYGKKMVLSVGNSRIIALEKLSTYHIYRIMDLYHKHYFPKKWEEMETPLT